MEAVSQGLRPCASPDKAADDEISDLLAFFSAHSLSWHRVANAGRRQAPEDGEARSKALSLLDALEDAAAQNNVEKLGDLLEDSVADPALWRLLVGATRAEASMASMADQAMGRVIATSRVESSATEQPTARTQIGATVSRCSEVDASHPPEGRLAASGPEDLLGFLDKRRLVWGIVLRAALDSSETESIRASLLEIWRATGAFDGQDAAGFAEVLQVVLETDPAAWDAIWSAAYNTADEPVLTLLPANRDSGGANSPRSSRSRSSSTVTVHLPDVDPDVSVDLSEARSRPLEAADADDADEVETLRVERDLLKLEAKELLLQCRTARKALERLRQKRKALDARKRTAGEQGCSDDDDAAEQAAQRALPGALELLGCLHSVLHRNRELVLPSRTGVSDEAFAATEDEQVAIRFLDEVARAMVDAAAS